MTQTALAYLAAGGILLMLAASAMLLLPGRATIRMRERVRSATGNAAKPTPVAKQQTIRRRATGEHRLWNGISAALGYNRDLPPAFAASPPLVAASSCLMGLVLFTQLRSSFGSAMAAIIALLAAVALARFLFRRKTKIYMNMLFIQIPDMLSLVVRSVRAGLPVGDALRSIATEMPSPTRDEFGRMMGEVALGVPLETALWSLHARTQVREYSFLAVTLGLHAQTGGNLAETLENLANMVRRRVAVAGKAKALSAEARMSSAILAGLPFVTGLIITLINPGYVGELFNDPRGKYFLIGFATLMCSGMLTIRWLLQRSTRD
ncbi:type II secretion system F family protein [Falsiroseomonas sp. E2-1-a4]|uniref:type II secretion system F family protein n=1 Tax=Falsiroseomonas sp. E2-1-a4 TaxID=3239299 RepID=UPI003F40755B